MTGLSRASFSQERLWFLKALDQESAIYYQLTCFRIKGRLDTGLLAMSLQETLKRHEALRTGLIMAGGELFQGVSERYPLDPAITDVDRLDDAYRLLLADARVPFDTERGPIMRQHLFRLASDDHFLGLVTPNLIVDGWSRSLWVKEMAAIYDAMAKGAYDTNSLHAPPMQYREYAAMQRKAFESGAFEAQVKYWKNRFPEELPVLQLPLDHTRPLMQPHAGIAFTIVLSSGLTASLRAFARGRKATLYMVLLSAFYLLLYRYSGQDDIVVGSPVAGRNYFNVEGMLGLFMNVLPMRSTVDPGTSFIELVAQVRKTTLEAIDNQGVPLEKLIEILPVHRSLNIPPVFQAFFQLKNFPDSVSTIGDCSIEVWEPDEVMARADLMLEVTEMKDCLSCRFEYPAALFDRGSIERMARHWKNMLEDAVRDPEKSLSSISMMDDAELMALRDFWEGPKRGYPQAGVDKVFRKVAGAYPGYVAIRHGQGSCTYEELDRWSDAIAGRLKTSGVRYGEVVIIVMERSAGLVAAMLGIIKAGAAYACIDPMEPMARLNGMAGATGARVLMTDKAGACRLAGVVDTLIVMDDGFEPAERLDVATGPESLAYVNFTSGSTGKPKGVCITHRGILRTMFNMDYMTIRPGDKIAYTSSPAFDVTTFEVWGTLLNGATIVIVDRDVLLSPGQLKEFTGRECVDILHLTAPLFNVYAKDSPAMFAGIRELMVGGDAMDPAAAEAVLRDGPPGRLLNMYGPTENTTFSSYYHVMEAGKGSVSIGRPIANSRMYILDKVRQPVPAGVPGDIYLAGDGLSAGYITPVLNEGAFFTDIFYERQMMYRSGDLGRYRPDGNVEFFGRKDGQVKIRGFRVETGEVVDALESLPGIKKAIVTPFIGHDGTNALAAYLVKPGAESIPDDTLRRSLAEKLPPYMIPAFVAWIDSIPLNSRGKIDYASLPSPSFGNPVSDLAPIGEDMILMSNIWKEVLCVPAAGPDDDYFFLGGHSLLAIRLLGRIEAEFGIRLPVGVIFRAPTIRQMMAYINEADKVFVPSDITKVGP